MNLLPKTVNNLFKFSAQDSDLEYLCWRRKNCPVSSDLKPPLVSAFRLKVVQHKLKAHSITSYSARDISLRDLCIMTLLPATKGK